MKRKDRKFFKNAMKAGVVEAAKIEIRGKVTAGKLNVRQKPSTNSRVIAQVHRNDLLHIANKTGDWYEITYDDKTAFVFAKYVQILRNETTGVITANVLNVRSQPNTDSVVFGQVRKNDRVKILKKYNDWHKIDYDGKAAFIYNKYVKDLNEDSTNNSSGGGSNSGGGSGGNTTSGDYFYQRKDLAKVKLEPKKTIAIPSGYKEKIAAKTWNNYGGLIQVISDELKIEVESALAVLCVESGGSGYSNGKMIIRFENHVFDMYFGKKNQEKFKTYFDYNRGKRRTGHKFRTTSKGKWIEGHTSQSVEWQIFEFARTISEREAIYSISMGAPQVMGFNYKSIGYATPQEMFEYFNKDIRYHLLALFDFCKYRPQRIEYLQKKDFYSFSREYNGSTAPAAYEKRIKEYYDIYKDIL